MTFAFPTSIFEAMEMHHQILFFFSALGVFNGLLFSVYILFFKKTGQRANFLLGALLLLTCIRVGVSCFYFFEKDIPRFFIQAGLMANFLIGPILFYYLKTALRNEQILPKETKIYLWTLVLGIVIFGITYPFSEYPKIWDRKIRFLIHSFLTLYCIRSFIVLKSVMVNVFQNSKKLSPKDRWLLIFFIANLLVFSGFVISLKTTYILGSVWFSMVLYAMIIIVVFNKKKIAVFEKPASYKKITESEAEQLILQLDNLMQEKRLFKNSDLKLRDIAEELDITSNRLSQLLNDNLNKGFSTYLNEYRVKEAEDLLLNLNNRYTIEAIGYESGFRSKSSFFSTFKKINGNTPSSFKKIHSEKRSPKR